MKASSLSRFLAVVLICIPLARFYSGVALRNLNQMNTNPAAYLQRVKPLQHTDFWFNFIVMLFALGAVVFIVEGLAQILSRWLPEKRVQAGSGAGTTGTGPGRETAS
jgi:hypothetical protein